jgi:hypothetical protein
MRYRFGFLEVVLFRALTLPASVNFVATLPHHASWTLENDKRMGHEHESGFFFLCHTAFSAEDLDARSLREQHVLDKKNRVKVRSRCVADFRA